MMNSLSNFLTSSFYSVLSKEMLKTEQLNCHKTFGEA
jgi:hypothetical protein